jgi:hypothetical protein
LSLGSNSLRLCLLFPLQHLLRQSFLRRNHIAQPLIFGAQSFPDLFQILSLTSSRIRTTRVSHCVQEEPLRVAVRGRISQSDQSNWMKPQMFLFVMLPHTEHFVVLEVAHAGEFSLLKNAPSAGTDDSEMSCCDLPAQALPLLQDGCDNPRL